MPDQPVKLDIIDGLASLTLASPAAGNAMDIPMLDALAEAALSLAAARPRAVLLRGEGKNFCVGGDIRTFDGAADRGATLEHMASRLHVAVLALHELEAPVIAAVQGAAAGAGLSLAIGADIVLAGAGASFTPAYSRIGFSPDGGLSYFLPRLIGLRRAQELTFLNRSLTADEALQWGLITKIVSDADLGKEAEAMAQRIAAGPTLAFSALKRLFVAGSGAALAPQLAAEAAAIAATGCSADGAEGLAAFLQRRPVKFTGK